MRALSPVLHLPPASPISAAASAVNASHRIDFSYCPFGFTQLKVGERLEQTSAEEGVRLA